MIVTTFFNLIPVAHAQVGLDFLNLPPGAEIGDVLSRLYVYGLGVVAISAMIMLVVGGVQYMVAGEKDPGPAKERMRNAIWGLILALISYLILYTINPDLTKKVKLKVLDINLTAPPTQTGRVGQFTCPNGLSYVSLDECNKNCEAWTPGATCAAPTPTQQGNVGESGACNVNGGPNSNCQDGFVCAYSPPIGCPVARQIGNCIPKAKICQ